MISDWFQFTASFLFVFAVVFGLLQTAKRKRDKEEEPLLPQRANILIALAFGLIAAGYQPFVTLIWNLLPIVSVILVFLFFVAFLREIFRGEAKEGMPIIVSLGILLILIGTFFDKIISILPVNTSVLTSRDLIWVIAIIIIGIMFYAAYKAGGEEKQQK